MPSFVILPIKWVLAFRVHLYVCVYVMGMPFYVYCLIMFGARVARPTRTSHSTGQRDASPFFDCISIIDDVMCLHVCVFVCAKPDRDLLATEQLHHMNIPPHTRKHI